MNTKKVAEELKSPCVRNCCLDDNDICVGCFRHLDEIIGWNSSSLEQKKEILAFCQDRRTKRNSKY